MAPAHRAAEQRVRPALVGEAGFAGLPWIRPTARGALTRRGRIRGAAARGARRPRIDPTLGPRVVFTFRRAGYPFRSPGIVRCAGQRMWRGADARCERRRSRRLVLRGMGRVPCHCGPAVGRSCCETVNKEVVAELRDAICADFGGAPRKLSRGGHECHAPATNVTRASRMSRARHAYRPASRST
jgi:hypothetical protein